MAEHFRQQSQKPKPAYQTHNALVTYYLLVMFSFFPLFLTNRYNSARHDKYYLFLGLTAALAITAIGYRLLSRSEKSSTLLKPFSSTDIAFLCFFGCACISTILSPCAAETLNADSARNNGLILLAAYTLVYFVITRMYVYKNYVIAAYLVFSSIVALLTILNYYYIDPLGMFEGYGEDIIADFGSTIGNKNIIATYLSLFLPAALMTLALNANKTMRIIGGVSVCFGGMGALCSDSSSVILGLSVAIPVMAVFSARTYDSMRRYILGMAIFFGSMKVLRLFSMIMGEHHKGYEFIQSFLIYSPCAYIGAAVCGAIWLLMYFGTDKLASRYPSRALTAVFLIITIAIPLSAILGILYFTLIDTTAELGSFERLLRFDDRWGTHRGFMWFKSVEEYANMNVIQKLFGAGPDMAVKVLEGHFAELEARFGDGYTDTAHNEYLNYLITQGALGLVSYLGILGTVIVRSIRRARENPILLVFVSAVICYAVQAAVNLYNPIVTPIFILFIAMAEGLNRNTPVIPSRR